MFTNLHLQCSLQQILIFEFKINKLATFQLIASSILKLKTHKLHQEICSFEYLIAIIERVQHVRFELFISR
jgi:hypothetical protein